MGRKSFDIAPGLKIKFNGSNPTMEFKIPGINKSYSYNLLDTANDNDDDDKNTDNIEEIVSVTSSSFFSKIAGVSYKNDNGTERQKILRKMKNEGCKGEKLYLQLDPNNQYDKNAVKVLNQDNEQLGYLKHDVAMEISERLKRGEKVTVVVSEITGGDNGTSLGCNIKIILDKQRPQISTRYDVHGVPPKEENEDDGSSLGCCIVFFLGILFFLWTQVSSVKHEDTQQVQREKSYAETIPSGKYRQLSKNEQELLSITFDNDAEKSKNDKQKTVKKSVKSSNKNKKTKRTKKNRR